VAFVGFDFITTFRYEFFYTNKKILMKEVVMKRKVNIALQFDLAIGDVNLNEIVYQLKEMQNPLMIKILGSILTSYDELISERLSDTKTYPSKARRGLGRHQKKGHDHRFCRGRKSRKRGFRSKPRKLSTVFGQVCFNIRVIECIKCGSRYSPLLRALGIEKYAHKEKNFEHEVIEAVIDTNYRRLIDGRSIDISLGGIHNIVVGSDIDNTFTEMVSTDELSSIMADGTGIKQVKGKKGELRSVIGITKSGRVKPLGCFANTEWEQIENTVRDRIQKGESSQLTFVYDGEPGLDHFLADIAETQRCTWHGSRGLYHALWEDGLKKKDSQPETDRLNQLIGIELPEEDIELIKLKDLEELINRYEDSKDELLQLIETFHEKGYKKGASYLESLSNRVFTNVEIWLRTGVIAPKVTSLLERTFRELGRRLKRIAWGWTDKAVTNLSKMIMLRQYSRDQWEAYWKEKLGIKNFFKIEINDVEILPCPTF